MDEFLEELMGGLNLAVKDIAKSHIMDNKYQISVGSFEYLRGLINAFILISRDTNKKS